MTLAAIFTAFALLASPASGPVPLAESRGLMQAQPQTTSPPPASQPEAAQPAEQQPKPDQTPAASPTQPAQPQAQPPAPAQPESTQPVREAKPPQPQAPSTTTQPKKHRKKKKKHVTPSDGPKKIIVRNGGASEPTVQIAPGGLSKQQASSQVQNTTQLLASTDANLQKLSDRRLNSSQQDTVKQIRTYMDQAKAATDAGDLQRAHNLAFKAHLLSDDLIKQ